MINNIFTSFHKRTKRNYLKRMLDNKPACMTEARKYEFNYWDGPRKYGFGGYKYISELLDRCYDGIIDKKEKDSLTLAEIETIKKVFDAIDDENAKTAIGTLEFMNRVSKFNTVNSTCFGKNDNANYEPLIKPMNI